MKLKFAWLMAAALLFVGCATWPHHVGGKEYSVLLSTARMAIKEEGLPLAEEEFLKVMNDEPQRFSYYFLSGDYGQFVVEWNVSKGKNVRIVLYGAINREMVVDSISYDHRYGNLPEGKREVPHSVD